MAHADEKQLPPNLPLSEGGVQSLAPKALASFEKGGRFDATRLMARAKEPLPPS
jgi:hypothetical protein